MCTKWATILATFVQRLRSRSKIVKRSAVFIKANVFSTFPRRPLLKIQPIISAEKLNSVSPYIVSWKTF